MSQYLIERIGAQSNIELLVSTEVERLDVDEAGALCRIAWRNHATGETGEHPLRHLFLFVGADPCADWLKDCNAAIDRKGFILTGRSARPGEEDAPGLMTSLRGVFAIGDVRSTLRQRFGEDVATPLMLPARGWFGRVQPAVERRELFSLPGDLGEQIISALESRAIWSR